MISGQAQTYAELLLLAGTLSFSNAVHSEAHYPRVLSS
jgi:hypothetical protein